MYLSEIKIGSLECHMLLSMEQTWKENTEHAVIEHE